MRPFRTMAGAVLAASASACTFVVLQNDLFESPDAGDDAMVAIDGATDAPPDLKFQSEKSAVNGITAYDDVLYASAGGQVFVCNPHCVQIVDVDAAPGGFGIAASDGGVYWTVRGGVWVADLDGGNATEPITDDSNPQLVVTDGVRASWTTRDDAGNVLINSCATPRNTCKFKKGVAPLDGGSVNTSGTGEGGASVLVDKTGNVFPTELAAGSGYVAWVNAGDYSVAFTFFDGGTLPAPTPLQDPSFNLAATEGRVASDPPNVFYAYYSSKSDRLLVRRASLPDLTTSAQILHDTNMNKSFCLAAGAQRIAAGGDGMKLYVGNETDGTLDRVSYSFGSQETARSCVVTSSYVFIIDNADTLFWVKRAN